MGAGMTGLTRPGLPSRIHSPAVGLLEHSCLLGFLFAGILDRETLLLSHLRCCLLAGPSTETLAAPAEPGKFVTKTCVTSELQLEVTVPELIETGWPPGQ